MQFNDTTNLTGIIQAQERMCGLGDGAISGDTTLLKQFTARTNQHYQKIVTQILTIKNGVAFDDINQTDYPEGTIPMVASQRDYTIDAAEKVLKIRRVEVTYDGTHYYPAERLFKENKVPRGDETTADNYYTTQRPAFFWKYGSLHVYPMATAAQVTAGAKIYLEWTREIDEFSTADTTQEPGIDEPYHIRLAYGPSIDYLSEHGKDRNHIRNLKESDKELENLMFQDLKTKYDVKQRLMPSNLYGNDYK